MKPEKYIEDVSNNQIPIENVEKSPPNNIPFWTQNPNILLQKEYIMEFFPVESMTYEQKLNAITRTVVILTIVGFAITRSVRLLLISAITIGAIYLIFYYHELENKKITEKKKIDTIKEGFESPALDFYEKHNIPLPNNVFQDPDSQNPFSNVLMTDYEDNPNKKPAPPAFNKNIGEQILQQAKKTVMETNPDQPDIADKLFKDLGEQLVFEQSLRPFHSNPATTIPNDQGAFAEFCYGGMVSCKEGNAFACARNMTRYNNY